MRRFDPPMKAADTLHRKAAVVKERINKFNAPSAACSGARDSLNCSAHGDAIAIGITSRFDVRKKRRFRGIKPLVGHWFPVEPRDEVGVEDG